MESIEKELKKVIRVLINQRDEIEFNEKENPYTIVGIPVTFNLLGQVGAVLGAPALGFMQYLLIQYK